MKDNASSPGPPIREVMARHGLEPKRSLGQNFLLDLNLTDKIVRHAVAGVQTAGLAVEDVTVLEVGPGPGALTRSLLVQPWRKVVAVEKDSRCVAALADLNHPALTIHEGDALTVDGQALTAAPRIVVANLPYNISTTLLLGWLKQAEMFQGLTLMFQKEVADRLAALPNTRAYGRLSVMTQWLCDVAQVFDIPPQAFIPPPKVTSTVVHLTPRALPADAPSFAAMEKVTALAFGQRRKMLRASLKPLLVQYPDLLTHCGIPETARAEDLSVEDFVRLAQRTIRKDAD